MKKSSGQITIGIELIDDPAWMGGTLYVRNLAICLSRLLENERPLVQLIGAPNVVSDFIDEWGHLPIFNSASNNLLGRISRRLGWTQKVAAPIDIIYPGFGAQVPGAVTMRWIPDFQHRYLPHLFSEEEVTIRDCSIKEIADKSGVVILSSEVAAKDFCRFYPGHLATPRVWHFCSLLDTTKSASYAAIGQYGLPEKYLYLPNQFWAHKNHITVFKALARLRHERGIEIPIVCTGAQSDRRNETHFSNLQQFIQEKDLTGQVHLLGLIERNDQIEVLRHAAAVIQPSLFEGWSTVVEDVRATGRPIFLSDIPVHREQNPPHCSYFNPESDEQLAEILACQWGTLRPGTDVRAESEARQDMETRTLNSAHVFCEIANMALDISNKPKF